MILPGAAGEVEIADLPASQLAVDDLREHLPFDLVQPAGL
jgi:hypothetical protein